MTDCGRELIGLVLAIVGFLGSILTCVIPMWKVTAFIGMNIVTNQVTWEGLWKSCVVPSTGQTLCKLYDSYLAIPKNLQAARVLTIIAIIVGVFGIVLGVVGGNCTNFVSDNGKKSKESIASGVLFIIAGILELIPVSWVANNIISDFHNPLLVVSQKTELGASIFIGWMSAGLLLLGGGLFCCSCPPKDETDYEVKYSKAYVSKA